MDNEEGGTPTVNDIDDAWYLSIFAHFFDKESASSVFDPLAQVASLSSRVLGFVMLGLAKSAVEAYTNASEGCGMKYYDPTLV